MTISERQRKYQRDYYKKDRKANPEKWNRWGTARTTTLENESALSHRTAMGR